MIITVNKIAARDEGRILKEYYKFFQYINGKKDILDKNLHFTTDRDKLTDKELKNKSFMDALEAVENNTENITFALTFDESGRISSVARIELTQKIVHICDIVYLNYPDVAEKLMILNEIIQKATEMASLNGQDVDFEVPTNDSAAMSFAKAYGFKQLKGDERIYRTIIFTKKIEKREINGQTLSRKQGKEFN